MAGKERQDRQIDAAERIINDREKRESRRSRGNALIERDKNHVETRQKKVSSMLVVSRIGAIITLRETISITL